jgi:antitoxin HicB
MMQYWAKIKKQSDGNYLVEFPELPGCFTEGKSLEEAKEYAKEALDGWLTASCDRHNNIPTPKKRSGRNFYGIDVNIKVAFAVKLRLLRKKKRLTQAEVAKRLGISQQAYAKLEIPDTANPSLTTIQNICEALKVDLDFDLVA